jgi:uncharacterized protein YuzE
MRFSYYPETDSLWVDLRPGEAGERRPVCTVVISEDMNVDVDPETGLPVSIDVYQNASKVFDLSRLEAEGPIFGLVPVGEPDKRAV